MMRTAETEKTIQSDLFLIVSVLLGLAASIILTRWIDVHRPASTPTVEDERLYITSRVARPMSLGFGGLVADWYWMRSLQYVGGKILSRPKGVEVDDLRQLDLRMLGPLLDMATTLDPEFLDPYEYAAVVLSEVDVGQAIRILRKGIEKNPGSWRLYQHLGYVYWQQRDFQSAAETYGKGAMIPGAPPWMLAMKGRMAAEGGNLSTARDIYSQMFENSNQSDVKEMARRRLLQIDSFEQRDTLKEILAAFRMRTGHCPDSWKELGAMLMSTRIPVNGSGQPLDPSGTPYVLRAGNCDLDLDPASEVPYR